MYGFAAGHAFRCVWRDGALGVSGRFRHIRFIILPAFGCGPLRATVLDARRGEIYGAVYDVELNLAKPEMVMKFPHWLDTLPEGPVEFISTDFSPFTSALAGTRFEGSAVVEAPRALAGAIARIAEVKFCHGQAVDPSEVDANYVRRSDAELFWKEI